MHAVVCKPGYHCTGWGTKLVSFDDSFIMASRRWAVFDNHQALKSLSRRLKGKKSSVRRKIESLHSSCCCQFEMSFVRQLDVDLFWIGVVTRMRTKLRERETWLKTEEEDWRGTQCALRLFFFSSSPFSLSLIRFLHALKQRAENGKDRRRRGSEEKKLK